jgi:hypothetical protein
MRKYLLIVGFICGQLLLLYHLASLPFLFADIFSTIVDSARSDNGLPRSPGALRAHISYEGISSAGRGHWVVSFDWEMASLAQDYVIEMEFANDRWQTLMTVENRWSPRLSLAHLDNSCVRVRGRNSKGLGEPSKTLCLKGNTWYVLPDLSSSQCDVESVCIVHGD